MANKDEIAHINVEIPEQVSFMLEVVKMFNNAGKIRSEQAPKREMIGAVLYHYTMAWLESHDYLDSAIRSYQVQNHKVFNKDLYKGFKLFTPKEIVEDVEQTVADSANQDQSKDRAADEISNILEGIEAEKAS